MSPSASPLLASGLAHLDAVRARAARLLPPAAIRVLEVGCGTGQFLRHLPPRPGRRVYGVDRTRWAAGEFKIQDSRFKIVAGGEALNSESGIVNPSVLADAGRLPFRDGVFDAVFCVNTLQVLDPARAARALSELARVARPGAPVVVTFPNRENPVLRARLWGRRDDERSHAFRAADVLRRLAAAGAAPLGVEGFVVPSYGGAGLPVWGATRRALAGAYSAWMARHPRWAPQVVASAVKGRI